MKRREKNLKKQTDGSKSNGAIERLGDPRCFSNNNKQLDADGDDDDDDDGDDDDGDDNDDGDDDDGCEAIERRCLSNKQQAASFSLNFSQISSAKAISSKAVNKNTDSDNYRRQIWPFSIVICHVMVHGMMCSVQ